MDNSPYQSQAVQANALMRVVGTTLKEEKLSGLSVMLGAIAKELGASGCLLWECINKGDRVDSNADDNLFVLAQWFNDGSVQATKQIPLNGTITGRAITKKTPQLVTEAKEDPGYYHPAMFLEEAKIESIASFPIKFHDDVEGAVSLYWNVKKEFTETDQSLGAQLSSLVPAFYQAIRDRAVSELTRGVNEILQEADSQSASYLPKEEMKQVLSRIAELIADTFQCLEASIYLEDSLESPDKFHLMATTWDRPADLKQPFYQVDDSGLTFWVIKNRVPISVFELSRLDQDSVQIKRDYEGINWDKTVIENLTSAAQVKLRPEKDRIVPLSYMVAPIFRGEKSLGAIRCFAVRQGAYYFTRRERELLSLIAEQVGRYWTSWMTRRKIEDQNRKVEDQNREIEEENRSWKRLVESIRKLNNFVSHELAKISPDEKRIFKEVLRATHNVIIGTDAMDIRLVDEERRFLYIAEAFGDFWRTGTSDEQKQLLERRFDVTATPPQSAGSHVYQTKKSYFVPDVSKDPYFAQNHFGTKQALLAPIRVGRQLFGVLTVLSNVGNNEFSKQVPVMVDLLGYQLGLYHHLALAVGDLRQTRQELGERKTELEKLVREQTQIYQDLAHQLKSPIVQAQARIQSALLENLHSQRLESNLKAVRSLCRRAKNVTMSLRLFAALARDEQFETAPKVMGYSDLIKFLKETAEDQQLAIGPRRAVKFQVIERGFEIFITREFKVDQDLFEHALNNVLDNAGKYSFSNTTVEIRCGLTRKENFHISIINRGLPIRPKEVSLASEHGWRSLEARLSTGEGQGIGLWIVKHIMEAHQGQLEIVPTTEDNITEVKLIFPMARR